MGSSWADRSFTMQFYNWAGRARILICYRRLTKWIFSEYVVPSSVEQPAATYGFGRRLKEAAPSVEEP